MHIAIVYRDALQSGGYPRDVRWLSGALAQAGADVHLVASPGEVTDGLGATQVIDADAADTLGDIDVVHLMGLMIPSQFRTLRVVHARLAVVSPLAQLMRAHLAHRWWKKLPYAGYVRAALPRRFTLHAFSETELGDTTRVLAPDHAFLAGMGVFPPPSTISSTALVADPYVLFFGRNDVRQKGLDRLLDGYAAAVAMAFDVPLVIAGAPHGDSEGFLTRRADALGIDRFVRVLGAVDEDAKWNLLAHATALVFLSRWDGPPRPIREALAVGTPVIVSDGTNMSQLVERAGVGMSVGKGAPEKVASALRALARPHSSPAGSPPTEELQWSSVANRYLDGYASARREVTIG